jgi:hypothetical protein
MGNGLNEQTPEGFITDNGGSASSQSDDVRQASYQVGQQVHDVLYGSESHGSSSSANSYAYQVNLLEHLIAYLRKFQEGLRQVADNYSKKLENLRNEGMMLEPYNRLQHEMDVTRRQIFNLVQHIEVQDIPAVKKALAHCEKMRDQR